MAPDAEYESPDEINHYGFTEYMPDRRQVDLDGPDTNECKLIVKLTLH